MTQHGAEIHVSTPVEPKRQGEHRHHEHREQDRERQAVVHQLILDGTTR